jgi:hypothetical protein
MKDRIKSRTRACLNVGIAWISFSSHSGIAYFAKVSPGDYTLGLCVLSVSDAVLDDLYICDRCDAEGVPDLMRSSGKHTEGHHLIRCLEPEEMANEDKASPIEQRMTSVEGRLDCMQTQLDDLTDRMGDLTGHTGDLTGRIGDLTGHIGDLNARIGNIEQLLHRLVGALEGRAA